MRYFSVCSICLCFAFSAFAAEPAKVSVYPPADQSTAQTTTPTSNSKVLEGTYVPAPVKTVEMPLNCNPPAVDHYRDRVLSVTPLVNVPEMKGCGDCGTPCGTPLFRGSLVTGCGTDMCESRGRPALFGGLFSSWSCKQCDSKSCATCETKTKCETCQPVFNGQIAGCAGNVLMRIKAWICFQPCDGARLCLLRPSPYMASNMTVFPCKGCNVGSCHSAACTGMGNCSTGSCATSNCSGLFNRSSTCATGHCGEGSGIGGRLFGHNGKTPQDCNGAEPKLSGTSFCGGYRFATIEPRVYGQNPTRIDPIGGVVKAPKDESKMEVKNDAGKIEQASAMLPTPYQMPGQKNNKKDSKDMKANPLAVPFSNP